MKKILRDLEKPKSVIKKMKDSFEKEGRLDKALTAARALPNLQVSTSGKITLIKPKNDR